VYGPARVFDQKSHGVTVGRVRWRACRNWWVEGFLIGFCIVRQLGRLDLPLAYILLSELESKRDNMNSIVMLPEPA
jgi:hypothetical protein